MARVDRWQNLVSGAFRLSEAAGRGVDACAGACADQAALDYLDNVLEVFGPGIDPVEDWEGYAVRRMALALREALIAGRSA